MSRPILKAFYETGDQPNESEFSQTIDELAHLSDDAVTQAQAEDDTDTNFYMWSPERVWQAIAKALIVASLQFQNETTTARQLSSSDEGYLTRVDNAATVTLTIPTNAVDPLTIGKRYRYQKVGDGDILISFGAPTTIDGKLNANNEHRVTLKGGYIECLKTGTDRWSIIGDLDHIKMVDIS